MNDADKHVQPVANLREFFRDTLHGALVRQHLSVEDQTEHYVVNLLTLFSRSEALYESTPDGLRLKPLVAMLCQAPPSATATCSGSGMFRCSSPASSHRVSLPSSSTSITTSPWAGAPMAHSR